MTFKAPCCGAALTGAQIRSLNAKLNSSLNRKRSGGKVWRKHKPGYSRCKCAGCNLDRENTRDTQ